MSGEIKAVENLGDSVAKNDQVTSTKKGTKNYLNVYKFETGIFANVEFDSITYEYPDVLTEIIRARIGGVSGTIQASAQVKYQDSCKQNPLYIVRL